MSWHGVTYFCICCRMSSCSNVVLFMHKRTTRWQCTLYYHRRRLDTLEGFFFFFLLFFVYGCLQFITQHCDASFEMSCTGEICDYVTWCAR